MITEASFIPITPKKIPENFFSLIEKLSDTSKYLVYRVDVTDFSLEHWNRTKEIYENKGGKVILNSRLRSITSDHEFLHLTSSDLIETKELSSCITGASCHNKNEVIKAAQLELDYIFMPCVCFDERGFRVGMGQGYYDHSLDSIDQSQTKLIILAHEIQKTESCYPEKHDIKADFCLTDKQAYRFE